jgi:hypothetical protein
VRKKPKINTENIKDAEQNKRVFLYSLSHLPLNPEDSSEDYLMITVKGGGYFMTNFLRHLGYTSEVFLNVARRVSSSL